MKNLSYRSHKNRASLEFYPTPPEATRALLSVEKFVGSIWEPACGDGAISKVLLDAGYDVVSTDLAHREFGQGGINFLRTTKPLAKNIITNPPYGTHGLADVFIRRALLHTQKTGGKVAMLLNWRSICNPKRHHKFIKTPPSAIYAIDRLICWPYGKPTSQSRSIAKQQYCWLVWDGQKKQMPKFWWLSMNDFKHHPTKSDRTLQKS